MKRLTAAIIATLLISSSIAIAEKNEEQELRNVDLKEACSIALRCEDNVMGQYRACLEVVDEIAQEKGYSSAWVAKTKVQQCNSSLKHIRGCYGADTTDELNRRRALCELS